MGNTHDEGAGDELSAVPERERGRRGHKVYDEHHEEECGGDDIIGFSRGQKNLRIMEFPDILRFKR